MLPLQRDLFLPNSNPCWLWLYIVLYNHVKNMCLFNLDLSESTSFVSRDFMASCSSPETSEMSKSAPKKCANPIVTLESWPLVVPEYPRWRHLFQMMDGKQNLSLAFHALPHNETWAQIVMLYAVVHGSMSRVVGQGFPWRSWNIWKCWHTLGCRHWRKALECRHINLFDSRALQRLAS